jgi:hypothetical protein
MDTVIGPLPLGCDSIDDWVKWPGRATRKQPLLARTTVLFVASPKSCPPDVVSLKRSQLLDCRSYMQTMKCLSTQYQLTLFTYMLFSEFLIKWEKMSIRVMLSNT